MTTRKIIFIGVEIEEPTYEECLKEQRDSYDFFAELTDEEEKAIEADARIGMQNFEVLSVKCDGEGLKSSNEAVREIQLVWRIKTSDSDTLPNLVLEYSKC